MSLGSLSGGEETPPPTHHWPPAALDTRPRTVQRGAEGEGTAGRSSPAFTPSIYKDGLSDPKWDTFLTIGKTLDVRTRNVRRGGHMSAGLGGLWNRIVRCRWSSVCER